jgi:hypothetical protein
MCEMTTKMTRRILICLVFGPLGIAAMTATGCGAMNAASVGGNCESMTTEYAGALAEQDICRAAGLLRQIIDADCPCVCDESALPALEAQCN